MRYILLHFLIFALPVSIGLGLLAAVVRMIAARIRAETTAFSLRTSLVSSLFLGVAGALGQLCFQTLYYGAGWAVTPSRYVAYLLTGFLTGIIAHRVVPCTTLARASAWGLVGGSGAELGFMATEASFRGSEMPARIVSEALLCGIIALAVRFDLEPATDAAERPFAPEFATPPVVAIANVQAQPATRSPLSYTPERTILPAGGRIRNCPHCIQSAQGRIRNR